MIVRNWALVAIVLLQLTVCYGTTTPQSLSKGETCHLSPGNFWQLQDNVISNRHILLDEVKFSLDRSIGFIFIENVSNLTISGGGSGSLIQCSPVSTFGLHLKNATNVTLNGINITNCASVIAGLTIGSPCPNDSCQTSVLIEASNYISFSRVHIEHSPGIAVTVVDSLTDEPFGYPLIHVSPNLALTNCTMTHSRHWSMVLLETRSLLLENTVIANSNYGIFSVYSDVMMKNIDIVNCKVSLVNNGNMVVRERLIVRNSSINISKQDIHISGSSVVFEGDETNDGLIGFYSRIFITEHSVVVFTRFNHIALSLREDSYLHLNNSTLNFTKNNASTTGMHNYEPMFLHVSNTRMNIVNGSSLVIAYNSLINGRKIDLFWNSNVILNAGELAFENNEGHNVLSFLIYSSDTTIDLQNKSCVKFSDNKRMSLYILQGKLIIRSDSTLFCVR